MSGLAAAAELAGRLTPAEEGERAALVERLTAPSRPRVLGFVNAHAVNLCAADPSARAGFLGADVLLRDGSGMALMLRLLGRDPGANLNGTDLIPALLAARPGLRVALYGGRPGVAEDAARIVEARGAHVVAARHGHAPDAAYLAWLAEDAPDIVVLAMGMPRQETLALTLRASPAAPRLIVCGGAVLDFMAGRVPRAPRALRRLGLEWAFRLALEPRRLFRRYVIGNPLFMLRAAALALAPSAARAPASAPLGTPSEKTSPAMSA